MNNNDVDANNGGNVDVAAADANHKRKLLAEWSCPICLDTVGEKCIPAVMNGCMPFAHVVCLSCLNELLAQRNAQCPECRAEFTSVRPLAAFVDKDDPEIADALAKRAKTVTLNDRLATLNIVDEHLRKRVVFAAKRVEKTLKGDYYRIHEQVRSFTRVVPDFDSERVCLLSKHTKRVMGRYFNTEELTRRLTFITNTVVPYLHELFPDHLFDAYHDQVAGKHKYMSIRIRKRFDDFE